MALSSGSLQGLIDSKLESAGLDFNDKSSLKILTQAIAEAVVEHITASAQVAVTGGSSSGTYKVS